jgi:hypothetical protein
VRRYSCKCDDYVGSLSVVSVENRINLALGPSDSLETAGSVSWGGKDNHGEEDSRVEHDVRLRLE